MLVFEDRNKGQQILDICLQMEKTLQNMTCHKSCLLAFHRWLTDDTLGTLDQVPSRYTCKLTNCIVGSRGASDKIRRETYQDTGSEACRFRLVICDCSDSPDYVLSMLLPGRDLNNEPEDEEEMEDKQRVNTDDSVEVVENKERTAKVLTLLINRIARGKKVRQSNYNLLQSKCWLLRANVLRGMEPFYHET